MDLDGAEVPYTRVPRPEAGGEALGYSAGVRHSWMLVFVFGCRVPADGDPDEPAPEVEAPLPPSVAAPRTDAAAGGQDEDDEQDDEPGAEEVELEWPEGPFEADLDADGVVEKISWSCDAKTRVQAGAASYEEKHGYAELIGCTTTTLDLDPKRPGRELLFIGDEHEEAGPDRHVILSYVEGKLVPIWAGDASISFYPDGSWVSETYDCDDVGLIFTTTTQTHRWVDGKVQTQTEVAEEKIEAGDCAEP